VRFIPGDNFEVTFWWIERPTVEMEWFGGVPSKADQTDIANGETARAASLTLTATSTVEMLERANAFIPTG
jgi:hypothetical protein